MGEQAFNEEEGKGNEEGRGRHYRCVRVLPRRTLCEPMIPDTLVTFYNHVE